MPLLVRDLGFPNLVPLLLLFLLSSLALLLFHRWRLAVSRSDEVRRLIVRASEEAARAELEAAADYYYASYAPAAPSHPQCAVCFSPTTTRCSRCKAIRYCSGKCQIIHWRQGHKDECHPPSSTVMFNDTKNDSDGSLPCSRQLESEQISLEPENGLRVKQTEESHESRTTSESVCSSTVPAGKDDKFSSLMDDGVADSSTVRVSTAGCSASLTPSKLLVNASVHKSPLPTSSVSLRGTLLDVNVHDTARSMPDVASNLTTRQTTESSMPATAGSVRLMPDVASNLATHQTTESSMPAAAGSVNTSSRKVKQKSLSCSAETVDELRKISNPSFMKSGKSPVVAASPLEHSNGSFGSKGAQSPANGRPILSEVRDSGDHAQLDSGFRFSFNLSDQTVSSGLSTSSKDKTLEVDSLQSGLGNGMSKCSQLKTDVDESLRTIGLERSLPLTKERKSSEQMAKSSGSMRCSSGVSADRVLSGARCSTSNIDCVKTMSISCDKVNSTPIDSSNLKTSMRKVVQQFKPSKLSKHYQFGVGSEVTGKYKTLFPYDVFVKLYNLEKLELQPCGLTNCGNSCYANAVLQCLAFTRPLTAYLLQGYHSKSCSKKDWCFTCEFESLVLKVKEGKSPISPQKILSRIQSIGSHLGHGREEDAHEFLRYAIDTMQSVCLKEAGVNAEIPLAEETTLIQLIFGGYLRSKIKCMKCQGKSERRERMLDLTVEIHGEIGTLEEALARFTATEILDGDNKYQCGRCKSYEKAKKKLTVLEAPNILTIALKRFQSGKFGKLNKSVRFPEYLDLAPYMSGTGDKSPLYRLYAVVVHLDVMNAAFSGHYVCYVKNLQGKWFKIDDSMVKPVEPERVLSKTAYMLLYARSSPRAPSAIRNAVPHAHLKNKPSKWMEIIPSSHSDRNISKGRHNPPVSLHVGSSEPLRRTEDYPCWTGFDQPADAESLDLLGGGFFPVYRIRKVDSSSDNSSLLSCSDEGSCSTESTRDSTSTDEYSEYIFGELGSFSWNSSYRMTEDSDFSNSPAYSRASPTFTNTRVSKYPEQFEQRRVVSGGKDPPSFLYSDSTNWSRKLTGHHSSSDIDRELLGGANQSDLKSVGVSLRRPRQKTTQTFY